MNLLAEKRQYSGNSCGPIHVVVINSLDFGILMGLLLSLNSNGTTTRHLLRHCVIYFLTLLRRAVISRNDSCMPRGIGK